MRDFVTYFHVRKSILGMHEQLSIVGRSFNIDHGINLHSCSVCASSE